MIATLLDQPTLVLNRNWQAINVAPVARALVLVWNQSARIVDPADFQTYDWADWSAMHVGDDELAIQAVRYRLRVPEVITLTHYDRLPATNVSFSRHNLFKRDHYTCQYCGRKWQGARSNSGPIGAGNAPQTIRIDELTIDHVIPRAQGGQSRWDNCVLACLDCNARKANRTPAQAGLRLRREPVQPIWTPLYAVRQVRCASWTKFLSNAYWNVELAE